MALLARTGRQRQRYENHFRLVSGCIPYRLKQTEENHTGNIIDRLEVLMVSSPNRHDLVFPKGGWENDETVDEAACREAWEEAGVRGVINETILGIWEFKSKSRQNSCSLEGSCRGYMFALEVTEELQCWPEKANRERRWVNVREALQHCRYGWMREALNACIIVLSAEPPLPTFELSEPLQISEASKFFLLKPGKHLDSATDTYCW